MASVGEFYKVEKNGNLFLIYHHPKYQPIPPTQSSTSSGEDKLLFLCPHARRQNHVTNSDEDTFLLDSSPEYVLSKTSTHEDKPSLGVRFDDHPVHSLLSCKNIDAIGGCPFCHGSNFDTCYYFCEIHRYTYHKECVESPLQIQHPYHPQHSLQLHFHYYKSRDIECLCCGRSAINLVYKCTICQIFMHPICAMKPIPIVINPPKRHDHLLTFFPRQTSLTCNVCGLLRTLHPTYICAKCNFVSHNDCMNSPHIIKISRHHHRISYRPSLPSVEWSCGVCRKNIDGNYGAYTCDKCENYAVHSRCALRKDVWDGVELQDVSDDIKEEDGPFEMVSEGVILHFLHDHYLRLEVSILYDENKLCEACVLPIFEEKFYSCTECSFILHETCAKACRKVHHSLHPHPLILKSAISVDVDGWFTCKSCGINCAGFGYHCPIAECGFKLDVRCASISEPFTYPGHEHPLFLALDPEEEPICHVCKKECVKQLNCIECGFIICFGCASLPYRVRYKHDKHFLRLMWGEEVFGEDWCEACECNLGDTDTKSFYWCKECCTTLHIKCLLGEDLYYKPGQINKQTRREIQILGKSNISRPSCNYCNSRCQGLVFKRGNRIACSLKCSAKMFY